MSGGQWMGFYWKDGKDQVRVAPPSVTRCNSLASNQLIARRGNLPDRADDPWTTFEMELREPAPIPSAFDLTRFLVSSITFMAHLREVGVYFDDKRLAFLTKDAGIHTQVPVPQGLSPTSPAGCMKIKGLRSTRKGFTDNEVRSVLTNRHPRQLSTSPHKS